METKTILLKANRIMIESEQTIVAINNFEGRITGQDFIFFGDEKGKGFFANVNRLRNQWKLFWEGHKATDITVVCSSNNQPEPVTLQSVIEKWQAELVQNEKQLKLNTIPTNESLVKEINQHIKYFTYTTTILRNHAIPKEIQHKLFCVLIDSHNYQQGRIWETPAFPNLDLIPELVDYLNTHFDGVQSLKMQPISNYIGNYYKLAKANQIINQNIS